MQNIKAALTSIALLVSISSTLAFPNLAMASSRGYSSACLAAYGIETSFQTIPMIGVYREVDRQRRVPYLMTSAERAVHRLHIVDGEFARSDGTRLGYRTENFDGYAFVMDAQGNLYAWNSRDKNFDWNLVHHSTFLAGGDVAMAGRLIFFKGKLVQVNTESGHYKVPDQMISQVAQLLRMQGVDTSTIEFISASGTRLNVSKTVLDRRVMNTVVNRQLDNLLKHNERFKMDEDAVADLRLALKVSLESNTRRTGEVIANIWKIIPKEIVEEVFLAEASDQVRSMIKAGRPIPPAVQDKAPVRRSFLQRLFGN